MAVHGLKAPYTFTYYIYIICTVHAYTYIVLYVIVLYIEWTKYTVYTSCSLYIIIIILLYYYCVYKCKLHIRRRHYIIHNLYHCYCQWQILKIHVSTDWRRKLKNISTYVFSIIIIINILDNNTSFFFLSYLRTNFQLI